MDSAGAQDGVRRSSRIRGQVASTGSHQPNTNNVSRVNKRPRFVLKKDMSQVIGRLSKQLFVPRVKPLALENIAITEDPTSCSFCPWETSFGIENENALLPSSASDHTCRQCRPLESEQHLLLEGLLSEESTMGSSEIGPLPSYLDESFEICKAFPSYPSHLCNYLTLCLVIQPRSGALVPVKVKFTDTLVELKLKLAETDADGSEDYHLKYVGEYASSILADKDDTKTLLDLSIAPKITLSVVPQKHFEGKDITQYWEPMFCRGWAWRQVDLKKAKICTSCKSKKSEIIQHPRHCDWVPYFGPDPATRVYPLPVTARPENNRNCMICTNLAVSKCLGCPLVVCSDCATILDHMCTFSSEVSEIKPDH
jgi:hypothetical protein